MSKQYHYVVMYDNESNSFSIEWDTTQIMLEENQGTIFDTDTQEWEAGFGNEAYEEIANKLAKVWE